MSHTSAVTRAAAALVGLEGVGLIVLAVQQIAASTSGESGSIAIEVALIAMILIGAVALIAFAVAIWRRSSWGRSGAIVAQVLIIGVAVGAATGAYAHPLIGLLLAMPAVAALVLLILAARPEGRDRSDDERP